MKCNFCGNKVGQNPVQANIWGRKVFLCDCSVCYEQDGRVARSQSDSRKIICFQDGIRVDKDEKDIYGESLLIGLCVEDDKNWLEWKGLVGA